MAPTEHTHHPTADLDHEKHPATAAAAGATSERTEDRNAAIPPASPPQSAAPGTPSPPDRGAKRMSQRPTAAVAGGNTMNAIDQFPDVHDQPLPYPEGDVPDPRNQATKDANALHDRVYEAVMYVLVNDFQFAQGKDPIAQNSFPGTDPNVLDADEQALFLAVYGMMLADGWDPTMGRTEPGPDDTIITETKHFIVRRFVDATVAAVQEYTSNASLFKNVYGLLGGGVTGTDQASVH